MELEFSLDAIGFDMGEIDFRIETAAKGKKTKPHEDDQLPPSDNAVAVTAPGDLWVLGRHGLLCASSLEEKSFEVLLGDARAAMVFTDPPYNVPIRGHVSGLGRVTHREFPMASGELSSPAFADFLTTTLNLHGRFSLDGSVHFLCMGAISRRSTTSIAACDHPHAPPRIGIVRKQGKMPAQLDDASQFAPVSRGTR